MPPATSSSATPGGIEKAVRASRSEEASPRESQARATHRRAAATSPPRPPWMTPSATKGPFT